MAIVKDETIVETPSLELYRRTVDGEVTYYIDKQHIDSIGMPVMRTEDTFKDEHKAHVAFEEMR